MTTTPPSEHDIHAYVDGHLDGPHRSEVERYLARHPEQAEEVQGWRQDAQQLRALLAGDLAPAPALDPDLVRARARQRRRTRWAMAASLFLCLTLGGIGGWAARGMGSGRAPMADAMQAYRLLALDHGVGMDITTGNENDLRAWLAGRVGSDVRLPDLADAGFRPMGGRLFATDQGPAAMVLYDDGDGHTVSFYVRPPGPARHLLSPGEREEGGLLANYWSSGGHNYAVVAMADRAGRSAAERVVGKAI
ncbi:anti-sigma factor family protein [Luteibacter sp. UNCMF366Tsu5.1]|uniref:anti-sigma factor family protein n=1 Tax=Luteibacter sp. UNCMF366Tsu5.1 TaxID=1502758 RepID=UPI000908C5A7|nr:anti-sigma factor [Luteibacter sp. UNCMF366Tsu5.1]SFW20774.1 Transmembrane transcriptional regulator (anti-sigma factor RsiW) [Luteibacter sp. UNCMF366Tsu5.1]